MRRSPSSTARLTVVAAALAAALQPLAAHAAEAPSAVVPGEVIVRFDDPAEAGARVRAWGGEVALRIGLPGLVTAQFGGNPDTAALAKEIAQRPGVRWAEPNRTLELAAAPNDPRYGEQWGLSNTGQTVLGVSGLAGVDGNLSKAWDFATGGDTTVAVADSGVALTHPDLAANLWTNPGETGADADGRDRRTNGRDDDGNSRVDDWRGWDFSSNDNDPSDENGHGSLVSGVIGAVGGNGLGISGVSQRVKLMPLKIGSSSRTDGSINADAAAAAMLYASAKGAKVFNGSFSGSNASRAQEDAIAASPNTLFVFAAGNDGSNSDTTPSYPCSFNRDNVLCVGSITNQGALSGFSNYGVKTVDLAAPGTAILSTSPFTLALDDPFEAAIAGRWTVRTLAGAAQSWSASPNGDGTRSLRVNEGNGIPQNVQTALVGNRVNLSACAEPAVELDASAAFSNGAFDLAITEDANTSDASKWIQLSSGGTFPTQTIRIDLTKAQTNAGQRSFANKTVALVFVATANAGNSGSGPVVDNLKLSCKPNVLSGQELEYRSGTSFAAPQVAGAAALVASQFPGASTAHLRSAILDSVTPMASLTSKTVTGGRLNVFGALDSAAPAGFGLGAPAAGASTTDPQPAFSWDGSSDAKTGIARYELVIDGAVAATTDAAGRAAKPGSALAVGAHSWRVDAVDNAGLRTASETRSLTVAAAVPLGPPLKVGKLGKVTKASISKSGFSVPCTIGQAGRCRVEVRLSRADAKKLKLKVGKKATSFLVAKGSAKVGKSGKATVKAKPSKATGNAIKRGKKKVTFLVQVVGIDAAGRETVTTVAVRA